MTQPQTTGVISISRCPALLPPVAPMMREIEAEAVKLSDRENLQ